MHTYLYAYVFLRRRTSMHTLHYFSTGTPHTSDGKQERNKRKDNPSMHFDLHYYCPLLFMCTRTYLVGVDVRQHFLVVAGVVGLGFLFVHLQGLDVPEHVLEDAKIGHEHLQEEVSYVIRHIRGVCTYTSGRSRGGGEAAIKQQARRAL